tara:strand:- start:437 stop:1801 length:1365 start_codon:yes stop_codon:yes gene_type:complete
MAYKFQLGAATMSGSVTFKEAGTFSSGLSAGDSDITNVGDIKIDSISADENDMTISLTDNRPSALEFAEAGNTYLKFVTTNGSEAIDFEQNVLVDENNKIQFRDSAIFINSSTDGQLDIDADATVQITAPSLDIDASSGVDISHDLTIGGNLIVNGTTTTIDSVNLRIEDSLIEIARGDGSGAGSRVSNANAGLYISGSALDKDVSLTVAADGGRLKVSGSTAGFDVQSGGDYAINNTSVLDINGAAKVQSAVAGNGLAHSSGVLSVGVDNVSIEISSDELQVAAGGIENAMLAGSIADSKLNQITTAGKVALSALEIDGGTDIGEALVDADLLIVDNGAGGTNRKCAMSRLKTYIGSGTTTVTSGSDNSALAAGVNYFGAHGGAITSTLPGASAPTVGDSVKIKAGSDCSTTNKLTINAYANHTIDGVSSLVLESPFAAVECVYVVSGSWRVF